MQTPEKLRATALMLWDMANKTASWSRQEHLRIQAERLEQKARDMEEAETDQEAKVRILTQLGEETDPIMRIKLRASLDSLGD